jgi:FKBP-type peptidyl-prolyl cis-trans isomerase
MKRVSLAALLAVTACGSPPPAALPTPVAESRPLASVDGGAAVATDVPTPTDSLAATPEAPEATPPDLPAPSDVAAPPVDAAKTASGLASKVLQAGTGTAHPGLEDRVKVHYSGWTKRGRMFDSSVVREEPAKFGVDQVIKGWTEGLQLMVVGEKRRLWIPADLAYGDHPRDGAPAGALTFDVELLELTPAGKPPPVPKDVKAPPATAKKRPSGLAYRILKKGAGKGPSPGATSNVTVHYTGWTTDGKMFDSSVKRGEPLSFGVDQVIKGWTEGLQLMKIGDSYRFWIPANLAYGTRPSSPGVPAGMLVFDVELLGIDQ